MLLGLLAAAAAAVCYEGGYALQALEARSAPHHEALRASLLRRLLARPRWLIGTALTLVGAALQTLALAHAPVAVVQAVLALGLAGLLVLAHFVLHERIGVREVAAVAAVAAGVAVVASGAPARETTVASTGALIASLAVLGAVAVAPFALRGGPARPRLAVAGAAAADGLGAVALKLLADALSQGRLLGAAGALALAGAGGGLALTAEMSALQRLAAARVGPIVVAAQVVLPAVVAALALGEALTAGVVAGLALTVAGAAVLAAVPGVLVLRGEAQLEHDGGGGRQVAE
jgi:drug/metabolite transporter (DMT)-like permease